MFAVMEKTPRQAVTGPVPATEDRPKTACGHSSPAPHPHPLPDVPGRGSCFSAATEFSEARRNGAQLVGPWRTLVEQSAQASVDLHPELVLDSGTGGRHPAHGVILHPRGDLSGVGSLAVLIEKTVRLPWLPGCSWRSSLRGLRLIGNRSLGVDDDATARALVQRCAGLLESPRSRHACVLLEDVEVDSPLWRAAQQTRQARVVVLAQPQTRWTLRFPSDAAAYWGRFSAKTRYNFRRLQRLLPHTWCVVDQPSQVAAFLAEAAVVSQQSWQGKRLGVRVRSDQEQLRHFTQLAELGALRCYLLRSEGVPVAFAIGTQWNGRYNLEEIGYDARFAKSSPGTVLLLRMLEDMLERQCPSLLDFGFGDGDYKRLFGSHQSASGTLLLVSRRLGPTLATWMNRAGTHLARGVRGCLRVGGISRRLRQFYRHGNLN